MLYLPSFPSKNILYDFFWYSALEFQWKSQTINRKAIAYDKIGANCELSANSIKTTIIRVFLHAEFISAMKRVQNPTIFMKNARE